MTTENIKRNVIAEYISVAFSKQLFWIVSFSIITALAAQITVPIKPVPFTLQTLVVLLSGAFLGARNGALSQILYLFLGIIGLPVFAQVPDGLIGFARIFGPTGGYLLAFPFTAFLVGFLIEKNNNYLSSILSMFLGNILILISGSLYLSLFLNGDIKEGLTLGASIFSVWMVVKVFLAASIFASTSNKYKRLPPIN